MKPIHFAAILITISTTACQPPNQDPPDLQAYINEIRAAGMTEQARICLKQVAGILVGHTSMIYEKDEDSGGYRTQYRSNICPVPGLTSEKRSKLSQEHQRDLAPVMVRLFSIADGDHSGFVSSEEGNGLRDQFEFGHKAAHILDAEGPDIQAVSTGMGLSVEQFTEQLAQYRSYVARAREAGSEDLPAIDQLIEQASDVE